MSIWLIDNLCMYMNICIVYNKYWSTSADLLNSGAKSSIWCWLNQGTVYLTPAARFKPKMVWGLGCKSAFHGLRQDNCPLSPSHRRAAKDHVSEGKAQPKIHELNIRGFARHSGTKAWSIRPLRKIRVEAGGFCLLPAATAAAPESRSRWNQRGCMRATSIEKCVSCCKDG